MPSKRAPASNDAGYDDYDIGPFRERPKQRRRPNQHAGARESNRREVGKRRRKDVSQPFKCRRCKAFIGLPLTGGCQRNHCPACLHSLHVDGKTPGDRGSTCKSLMAPVGTFFRPNGEQVLVHRCLGCAFARHNRVAADDNPLLLMRLSLLSPRMGGLQEEDEETATA